ncbi:MAG TPA: methyltransferase domain-containing protein [Gemmatimonadales bacterium]
MNDDTMLPPEQVRADYNKTLRDVRGEYVQFRWLNSPTQRRHYQQTKAALRWAAGTARAGSLLEVGCGPAVWTPLFLPSASAATLVDISDEMLRGARRVLAGRNGVSFVRADFTETDLGSEQFDTAVSIRAFEYMPDKPRVLERFAHVLRPGGRLILVTKNAGWRDHQRAQFAAKAPSPTDIPKEVRLQAGVVGWQALTEMARGAGLREVEVHPVVIGSYEGLARSRPALLLFDLIHRTSYRGSMSGRLDAWTESVMLLATR